MASCASTYSLHVSSEWSDRDTRNVVPRSLCGMRYFDETFSAYYKALCSVHKHEPLTKVHSMATLALVNAAIDARDNRHLPIVAIDIAGAEAGHPAKLHKDAFMLAHHNFMYKT